MRICLLDTQRPKLRSFLRHLPIVAAFLFSFNLVAQPLSGTYTIGSTGTYATFNAAIADLNSKGVNGPVTFNIQAGTYAERITLMQVNGASATNTVSFSGAGTTSTILQYTGTNPGDWATILLDGADYIRISNITVKALGGSNAVGLLLAGGADNNQFKNMEVQLDTGTTSGNTAGIAFSQIPFSFVPGFTGKDNIMDRVNVTGGFYGVKIDGNFGDLAERITIQNSAFNFQFQYGFNVSFGGYLHFLNNKVQNMRAPNSEAMRIFYSANFEVGGNMLASKNTSLTLLLGNDQWYDASFKTRVYNNMVYGADYFALFCVLSKNVEIRHNSLRSAFYATCLFENSNDIDVRNNHIMNDMATPNGYIAVITNTNFSYLDYNNYYTTNKAILVEHNSTQYNTVAAWRAAFPAYNEHTFTENPNFISITDLHIDQSIANVRGINLGFTTDIDGDARCTFAPTLGADESSISYAIPSSAIAVADSIFNGSPVTFFSRHAPRPGEQLDYTWYINNVQAGKGPELYTTLSPVGTYNISLKIQNCAGYDSSGIIKQVVLPTSTPASDFVASNLAPYLFEEITLYDKSLHGPTTWEWTASPSVDAVFSDPFAANPKITFFATGQYEICLKTTNHKGTGTTHCKTAYITVNDNQAMCTNPGSTNDIGLLTDDGGLNGDYAPGKNCTFLINPACAAQVILKFKNFNLRDANDSLIIYDGTNRNAPLLGAFTGLSSLPGGSTGLVANSGKMFIVWNADGAGQSTGFEAYWTKVHDYSLPVPNANFSIPDSIFTGQTARFDAAFTGNGASYSWDVDYPNAQTGLEGGSKAFERALFTTAGPYQVKLTVSNCSGTDAIIKTVNVIAPATKPQVGFIADRVKIPVLGIVTLTDTTRQGPFEWLWDITPRNGVTIIGNVRNQNIQAQFTAAGTYTVKLKATNAQGTDSATRVAYIEVVDYCYPIVGNLSSDVGISRVKLPVTDNRTAIGTDKYSTYINDFAPERIYTHSTFDIQIERNTAFDSMSRKVWIDWNNDGDFNDSLELAAFEAPARTLTYTATIQVPAFARKGITVMRVGVAYRNGDNLPCGINVAGEFEDYALEITDPAAQAPVIVLNGQDPDSLQVFASYLNPGATATDLLGRDISLSINSNTDLDNTKLGTYYVWYTVEDDWGNKDSVTRTLVVYDGTAPVVFYTGSDTLFVEVFGNINDPGIIATDNYYSAVTDITVDSSNVNTHVVGVYTLVYTATDSSGNTAQLTRKVKVRDTQAPVLTLVGKDTVTVDVFGDYNEKGVTITDNYCTGAMQWQVDITPDTDITGVYELTYTATDCQGNAATAIKRIVKVVDRVAPVITLNGNELVTIARWQNYTDAGYTLNDNYYENNQITVDTLGDWESSSVEGLYYIQYKATDGSGNVAYSAKRLINVSGYNSVQNVQQNNGMKVYPNPSNGIFTLSAEQAFAAATECTVTDMLGKHIAGFTIEAGADNKEIHLEQLPTGIYYLQVMQGNNTTIFKLNIIAGQ